MSDLMQRPSLLGAQFKKKGTGPVPIQAPDCSMMLENAVVAIIDAQNVAYRHCSFEWAGCW